MSNVPVTAAGGMQGVIQHDELNQIRITDDAPVTAKPQRHAIDYIAPIIGFAVFIGLWYLM